MINVEAHAAHLSDGEHHNNKRGVCMHPVDIRGAGLLTVQTLGIYTYATAVFINPNY